MYCRGVLSTGNGREPRALGKQKQVRNGGSEMRREQWLVVAGIAFLQIALLSDAGAQTDPFVALRDSLARLNGASITGETDEVRSVGELHRWFNQKLMDLSSLHPNSRIVPLGIYRTRIGEVVKPSLWNFGVEYQMPLRTANGYFTVFSGRVGGLLGWAKVMFGAGRENVPELKSKVASNWAVTGEVGFAKSRRVFNPLFGITYLWVNPDSGADGQGNFLYVGNRLFLSPIFSLDLKAGLAMWRGFDNKQPSGWYAGAGLAIHRMVDLTRVGRPWLGPPESGLFYTPSLNTIDTKIMVPVRLFRELSLAPFAMYGADVGRIRLVTKEISSLYGAGAELRLFCDEILPRPYFNPYIGVQRYWVEYENPSGLGKGLTFYFGARVQIKGNFALDGNFGPAFWSKDFPVNKPGDWIAHVGLTASLGKIQKQLHLRGALLAKTAKWGTTHAYERTTDLLTADDLNERDGEIRIFAIEDRPPAPKFPEPVGDLSDVKFYYVVLDFNFNINPMNTKGGLLKAGDKQDNDVLIVALFNKNHSMVENLNDRNMLFHFVDFDHGQYFGYRWDANGSRQPEYRHFAKLGKIEGQNGFYWGAYDEYVKPLRWIDQDEILGFSGRNIERKLLAMLEQRLAKENAAYANSPTPERKQSYLSDYRIAYVRYPTSVIGKIHDFLKSGNFGVAVKVGKDTDHDGFYVLAKDASWMSDVGAPDDMKPDTPVMFDPDDEFFFSNHVKIQDLTNLSESVKEFILDGFGECSTDLVKAHLNILNSKVIPRLLADSTLNVTVTGYTDATPMKKDCQRIYGSKGQKKLALARAESVAAYLESRGIDRNRIVVRGVGIKNPKRAHAPTDRAVVLRIIEMEKE